jgi:hypothetical protein
MLISISSLTYDRRKTRIWGKMLLRYFTFTFLDLFYIGVKNFQRPGMYNTKVITDYKIHEISAMARGPEISSLCSSYPIFIQIAKISQR